MERMYYQLFEFLKMEHFSRSIPWNYLGRAAREKVIGITIFKNPDAHSGHPQFRSLHKKSGFSSVVDQINYLIKS